MGKVRVIGAAAVAFGNFGFFCPSYSPQAKKGADYTINKLYLNREWRGQSDLIVIHAVHANKALLPSKP